MPSHQERIHKQYEDLCSECLRRPNWEWDDESRWPWLCEVCRWIKYLKIGVVNSLNEHTLSKMTEEDLAKIR